jgi:ABC-type phosphate transport system ATPase subunit
LLPLAASDVLDKAKPEGKVTLQDTEVYVSPFNQAPIDPRKMFVFDFDKSFEDMILYDDATLGTRPTKIIRGENRTALLLCFDIDVSQGILFYCCNEI